jgi:tetratricopeptide (TPR) repeat protein
MNKSALPLIGILVGLFVLLSILDLKGEYPAERALWKINRKFDKYSQDPKAVPEVNFQEVSKGYQSFIRKYPNSKLLPAVYILSGRVFIVQKKYAEGREVFENTLKKYSQDQNVASLVLTEIINSYHEEGNWQGELQTYQRILKDYPLTSIGFNTPLLMAKLYTTQNRRDLAQKAFDDAIVYYRGLANKYPDSNTGFVASRALGVSYMAKSDWNGAINAFKDVLFKYNTNPNFSPAMAAQFIKSINTLSVLKLGSYDTAIGIYEDFMKQFPEHPLSKTLEGIVTSLKLLKEKQINEDSKK